MANQPTLLLVEDESPAVFAIAKYFTGAGYQVLTAFSAQEGLKTALERHPDAVILDVLMPTSNGLDILPELREDPWGKTAKVIVFSNFSGDEYKAIAHKYNVEKYLVKTDTSLKELEESVKQILPTHDS
ncbi:response regulator [Patescibacteria group bacterium]|nr:response regulator [Patescibacteria group bacterium]MBU1970504.1 response regulator [Patescibacteria group bacterium]